MQIFFQIALLGCSTLLTAATGPGWRLRRACHELALSELRAHR